MFTQEEIKTIHTIENVYYMKPIIKRVMVKSKEIGILKTFDYAHEILSSSKDDVEEMLDERLRKGEIKDKSQARKTIVGAAFSNLIQYIFLKCKEEGLIKENVFVTSKIKNTIFEDMITITVDGESQKPDMDIIIYSLTEEGLLGKCIVMSLKTSLRERAGQTYKWKLLLEIATGANDIKDKYNISYKSVKMPLVCFATVNFYNEINNPQHRGMFKFFDNSFIGKPIKTDFISNLSEIADYVNEVL